MVKNIYGHLLVTAIVTDERICFLVIKNRYGGLGLDRKIKVNIDACLPKMVTAETVYNKYGAVIIWENTEMDGMAINRLKDFGIEDLLIYESSLPVMKRQAEEKLSVQVEAVEKNVSFAEVYEKDTDEFKTILHDLSVGKADSLNKTVQIVNSVYSRKNDHSEIVDCITRIRKVDEYTYYHCINVSLLSMMIGKWMKLAPDDIYMLVQAGLLHDIGKSMISPEIINKPGKLSKEELAAMKNHPEYGYHMIKNLKGIDARVSDAVFHHHEREDGSGYPNGLQGSQISQFAKIIAIADTYDAMTANRSYKLKDSPFRVFDLMQNGCFGYLDPVILETFLSNISHYYIGYKVKLRDNRIAEVIYINKQQYGKPVLKTGDTYIDMSKAKNLSIEEVL